MNSEQAAEQLWSSQRKAVQVLMWANVLMLPATCPRCHHHEWWNINATATSFWHLHCTNAVQETEEPGEDNEEPPRPILCNTRRTWRTPGSIMRALPNNFRPHSCSRDYAGFCKIVRSKPHVQSQGLQRRHFESFHMYFEQ